MHTIFCVQRLNTAMKAHSLSKKAMINTPGHSKTPYDPALLFE